MTLLDLCQHIPKVLCGDVLKFIAQFGSSLESTVHAKGPRTVTVCLLGNPRLACNGLLSHTFCKCISLIHGETKGLDLYLETVDCLVQIIVSYDTLETVQPQGAI